MGSSGSSPDGSDKEEFEERSNTMPDLCTLQSPRTKKDRAQSSWDKQRCLKPLKRYPGSRPESSRQTSPRDSVMSPLETIDEPRRRKGATPSTSPRRKADHDRDSPKGSPKGTSSFAA